MKKLRTTNWMALMALAFAMAYMAPPALAGEPAVSLRWALGAIDADSDSPNGISKDTMGIIRSEFGKTFTFL